MTSASFPDGTRVDKLFRQHNAWLTRWVRSQTRTIGAPDDIASEVFLRLLVMPSIADVREPRAMMTTIARRVIYELRRRNDLGRAYHAELLAAPQSFQASPEEHLIVMEALQRIDDMLSSLPRRARSAFLYSQIDGMKYAEIASKLGVSVSMVGKYVAQGLRLAYTFDPNAP